jgi:hypothetical protein
MWTRKSEIVRIAKIQIINSRITQSIIELAFSKKEGNTTEKQNIIWKNRKIIQ